MGYLNKQQSCQNILHAIRTVLAGDRFVSPEVAQRLIGQAVGAHDSSSGSPVDRLSQRELEVFTLIGEGFTTGEIAKRLMLSPHTIDTHREKIKIKLNLRNAAELHRDATCWVMKDA